MNHVTYATGKHLTFFHFFPNKFVFLNILRVVPGLPMLQA